MREPRTTQRKARHHHDLSRRSPVAAAAGPIPVAVHNPVLRILAVVGHSSLDYRDSSHIAAVVGNWDRRTFEADLPGSLDCSSVEWVGGIEGARICRPF